MHELKLTMDGREERSTLMRLAKVMPVAVDTLKMTSYVERTPDYGGEHTEETDARGAWAAWSPVHLAPRAAQWLPSLHHLDLEMNKLDTLPTLLPPSLRVLTIGHNPLAKMWRATCRGVFRDLNLKLKLDTRENLSALMQLAKTMPVAVNTFKLMTEMEPTNDYDEEFPDEADVHAALGQSGPVAKQPAFRIPREILAKLLAARELHLYVPFFDAGVVSHLKIPEDVMHMELEQEYVAGRSLRRWAPSCQKH
ncbi:hypothetical protein GGF31_007033 [Allomyces arbusculus]|nr:hypothetical protein GGF31_007033 [Allomyces arbusculus]